MAKAPASTPPRPRSSGAGSSDGGTLILVDGALGWAIGEEIGLVPTDRREVPVGPVPGEGLDPEEDEDEEEGEDGEEDEDE